jgi:hypothetical protein
MGSFQKLIVIISIIVTSFLSGEKWNIEKPRQASIYTIKTYYSTRSEYLEQVEWPNLLLYSSSKLLEMVLKLCKQQKGSTQISSYK